MKIIKDNPSLMIAHQAQKVAMGDFFDTGAMGIHFISYLPFLPLLHSSRAAPRVLLQVGFR